MSRVVDFEALKRKIYLSYHQDGILDLVVGLNILGFGINMSTESGAYIILSWIGIIMYTPLKSAIAIPRMGYVQFDSASKQRTKLLLMLGMGLMTLSLFLGLYVFFQSDNFLAEFESWFRQYYLLVLAAFPAILLAVAGIWLGVYRFLLHAVLMIGVIFVGIQLDVAEPTFVMVLGGIITVIGLGLLIRFIRKYPAQKEADNEFS
ncbi:hypothetical protein [Candidatus Leptofilum sp.]|uniref:hypothetical protein n=1 Tax=Candidatus Leptofilum sp. TaxID=3241576 RepID=UPI003B59EE95